MGVDPGDTEDAVGEDLVGGGGVGFHGEELLVSDALQDVLLSQDGDFVDLGGLGDVTLHVSVFAHDAVRDRGRQVGLLDGPGRCQSGQHLQIHE